MPTVQGTMICPNCHEEFWYELDLRSGEIRKISMCACDRFRRDVEEFLRSRGLWEEFKRFHEEREREYRESIGEETEDEETEEEGGEE